MREESPAFALQLRLFEALVDSATLKGTQAFVVFAPDYSAIARARSGEATPYEPFVLVCQEGDIPYIDLIDAFVESGADSTLAALFMSGGHYSRAGNELIASWLGQLLSEGVVGSPASSRLE